MKLALAAAVALALGISIYAANGAAPTDERALDLDGDGYVSVLDMAILAQRFGQNVGTPDSCYTQGQYATPLTVDGYTFSTYLLVPPGDPAASGTPRRLVPCP